jgi:CRISPR/Cas system-associated exonuclease Cas4 (RecB family)
MVGTIKNKMDLERISGPDLPTREYMEKIPSPELVYTGTQVNYYFVCRRKLWLFSRNFEMEQSSDLVLLGKLLHAVKAYKLKYQ